MRLSPGTARFAEPTRGAESDDGSAPPPPGEVPALREQQQRLPAAQGGREIVNLFAGVLVSVAQEAQATEVAREIEDGLTPKQGLEHNPQLQLVMNAEQPGHQ
jgi:hypothetical protein